MHMTNGVLFWAASVTPRMEAVKVVAGGEAVLVVSLHNVTPINITW